MRETCARELAQVSLMMGPCVHQKGDGQLPVSLFLRFPGISPRIGCDRPPLGVSKGPDCRTDLATQPLQLAEQVPKDAVAIDVRGYENGMP